jgi:hypothetical protein
VPQPASHTVNRGPTSGFLPGINLPKLSLPRRTGGELSTGSQDRDVSTRRPSRGPEKDRRRDAVRSGEVKRLRREVGDLKGLLDRQSTDIVKLRGRCKRRDDRIARLEHEIGKTRGPYRGVVGGDTQHARAMEQRLKETEELFSNEVRRTLPPGTDVLINDRAAL